MSPLAEALRALSQFLVADASIGDTLQRVADITTDAVGPASFVGLSMLDDRGKPTTAIFTDPDSPEIDQAQYDSGRGPCLQAWRTQQVVRIDSPAEGLQEYPEFTEAATSRGIQSTLSMPLVAGDRGIGAMNLYAATPHAFTAEDEARAVELATAASVVLANSVAYWGAYELSQHLNTAMQSRAVIEQAKGVLMAQTAGLDADAAFDILVRASQRENMKLRDVAERIVSHHRPPVTPRSGSST